MLALSKPANGAPQVPGAPIFALHGVSDFAAHNCAGVPDTQLQAAENKLI